MLSSGFRLCAGACLSRWFEES